MSLMKQLCTCHKATDVEEINVTETGNSEAQEQRCCRTPKSKRFQKLFFWTKGGKGNSEIGDIRQNHDNREDESEATKSHESSVSSNQAEEEEENFSLLQLPNEIILKLAFYLPKDETYINLAISCKSVCSILMDKILWNQPYLAQHRTIIPITNTRPPRGCLRVLDLTDCVQATDRYIFFIVRLHTKIQDLTLAGCKKITDKSVRCIMRYLKKLRKFDMSDTCHISSRMLSEFCAYYNETLEYLDLSHSIGTLQDRYQLRGIKWKMPKLSVFKFNWDKYLDWSSVGGIWIIMEFLQSCTNIQVLELGGYDMLASEVSELGYGLPSLHTLRLPKCIMKSQEINKLLSAVTNKIVHLDISGCSASVTEEELFVITKTQRNLQVLDLSHCYHLDNGMVRMIIENLLELRELRLQSCHKVGDLTLDIIVKHPKISYLDVSDTCVTLTHLQGLLRSLPQPNALIVLANGCARDKPLRHDFWETVPKIQEMDDLKTIRTVLNDFQSQPQYPVWSRVY